MNPSRGAIKFYVYWVKLGSDPRFHPRFLLADAYYQSLLDSGTLGPAVQAVSRDQAWQELQVTPLDMHRADYEIMRLTSDWPFRIPPEQPDYPPRNSEIEQLAYSVFTRRATWSDATEQLQAYFLQQADMQAAARVAVLLADTYPYDTERQREAGEMAQSAGLTQDASRLLRRAAGH